MFLRPKTTNVYYEKWLNEIPDQSGRVVAITGTTSGTVSSEIHDLPSPRYREYIQTLGVLGFGICNQKERGSITSIKQGVASITKGINKFGR